MKIHDQRWLKSCRLKTSQRWGRLTILEGCKGKKTANVGAVGAVFWGLQVARVLLFDLELRFDLIWELQVARVILFDLGADQVDNSGSTLAPLA